MVLYFAKTFNWHSTCWISGGHAHPRGILHESEALAQVHQENAQDARGRGGDMLQDQRNNDHEGGLSVDELDHLWSERRHARRSCCE